ncbi:MAG: TonB-dependent receptor plug domain-containing protein [Gemmatimonadetes bacterium]|nr:TonB-dependent receptor plug domain-containing protein [Gemmatimonadota bacterium]
MRRRPERHMYFRQDPSREQRVMRSMAMVAVLAAGLVCTVSGQEQTGSLRLEVRTGTDPVANAEVVVDGTTHLTDKHGIVVIHTSAGPGQVTVLREGFLPVTVPVDVVVGRERVVRIDLARQPVIEEEVTVVASTRTARRIEDQPMRVEVLNREEVEEKMLMTPGDIGMMLNEMGGLRVQATSPSLGAASVRIQGMRGRYTRFLSDGLPLFGSQPGGLGLLQIPPMDLHQVEVIKGVASALYGAGAMGGVVNLISRRPGEEPEREVLVNRSTHGATDGVLWLSSPLTESWGVTFLGGGHAQQQTDVDGDGWADLPQYGRGVARPRLFWDDGRGQSFFATVGTTLENRTGGTQPGAVLPATGMPYRESLETRRFDLGTLWQMLPAGRYVLTARATWARQWHAHQFGEVR